MQIKPIPDELLNDIVSKIEDKHGKRLPFKVRGVMISTLLISTTLEILNEEKTKTLPQNTSHDIWKKTPDGLDRRLKIRMNDNSCRGHVVSEVLSDVGIVKLQKIKNVKTGKFVNGTQLISDFTW
jgi:hypothetical protein